MSIEKFLTENPWPEVKWTEKDRPVILIDGVMRPFESMSMGLMRINGEAAYIMGANAQNLPKICSMLNVGIMQFYDLRTSDLGPLTQIPGLKHLSIRWNTEVRNLKPVGEIAALETLYLEDTPRIRSLEPVGNLKNLTRLHFSGGMFGKNAAQTLKPLAALPKLEHVTLMNFKIGDNSLKPLADCPALKELHLSNQFPTEEYAWLAAKRPEVACDMFAPYVVLEKPIDGNDLMVVGSGKPMLNSKTDRDKIKEYEQAFEALKNTFR